MSNTIISGISAIVTWHTYNLAFTHFDNEGLSKFIATQLGCNIASDSVSTVAYKWWNGAINMSDVSNYAWGTQVAGPALVRYLSPAITLGISLAAGLATYVALNLIALAVFKMTASCRKSKATSENPLVSTNSESQLREKIEQTMLEVIGTTEFIHSLQSTINQKVMENFKTLQFRDPNLLESHVNEEDEKDQNFIRIQTIPHVPRKLSAITLEKGSSETSYADIPRRARKVKHSKENSLSDEEGSSSSEEGFFARLFNFCPGSKLPKSRRHI